MAIPTSSWSIDRFLKALGSKESAPGGGAAAALAGGIGASLGAMVSRIILARKRLTAASRSKARKGAKTFDRLSKGFACLIEADAKAYSQWVRACALARDGKLSASRVRQARRQAVAVPMAICKAAREGKRAFQRLEPLAGPHLRSDTKAGQAMLKGALGAAEAMVRVNRAKKR